MPALDDTTCTRLLAAWPVGRLATVTEAGRPHVVPCCFVADGDRLYSAVDAKPKSTMALRRLANVRANPPVTIVVDHYADDWTELWWVRVDGFGSIVDDAEEQGDERYRALELLAGKYHQYRSEAPRGPILRIDITATTGWAYDPTMIAGSGPRA